MMTLTEIERAKERASDLKLRQDKITAAIELASEFVAYVKVLIDLDDPRGLEMWQDFRGAYVTWLNEQSDLNLASANILKEELEEVR